MKKVVVIANRYVDSVSLMAVSAKVMKLDGVTHAESGMGAFRGNCSAAEGT